MADQSEYQPEFPEFTDPGRASLVGQAWDLLASSRPILPRFTYVLLWLCHIDNLAKIVQALNESAVSPEAEKYAGELTQLLTSPTEFFESVIKPCE